MRSADSESILFLSSAIGERSRTLTKGHCLGHLSDFQSSRDADRVEAVRVKDDSTEQHLTERDLSNTKGNVF